MHSRRTVPTQRSANAFARGACGGVRMTWVPAAVNTVSNAAVNFVFPVADQMSEPVGVVVESRRGPCHLSCANVR